MKTVNVLINFLACSLVIKSLNFGDSSLTSDSRGVVLTDDGISLSISADWSYKEDGWYIESSTLLHIELCFLNPDTSDLGRSMSWVASPGLQICFLACQCW